MESSWEGALLDRMFADFDSNEDQGFHREFSEAEVGSPASSTWIWMIDSSGSMSLAGAKNYRWFLKGSGGPRRTHLRPEHFPVLL